MQISQTHANSKNLYLKICIILQFFFKEETRPRVETEGMTLPQPPEKSNRRRKILVEETKKSKNKEAQGNEYVLTTQKSAWAALKTILTVGAETMFKRFVVSTYSEI